MTASASDTGDARRPVAFIAMTDTASSSKRGSGSQGVTYASAGVDIEAGDRAVDLFKPLAVKATRPEVRGGLGGVTRLFTPRGGFPAPPPAGPTEGVGTHPGVAQATDKHHTAAPHPLGTVGAAALVGVGRAPVSP